MLKELILERDTVSSFYPRSVWLWVNLHNYMKYLRRKNWFICFLFNLLTFGMFTFYIGKKLDVYEKDAWYSNFSFWVISFLLGIIPSIFLFIIFNIEIGCKVCSKLSVPLEKYYSYPYIWIIFLIIPIIGWSLFIVLYIYVHFWYIFYLKRGYGEKYIK